MAVVRRDEQPSTPSNQPRSSDKRSTKVDAYAGSAVDAMAGTGQATLVTAPTVLEVLGHAGPSLRRAGVDSIAAHHRHLRVDLAGREPVSRATGLSVNPP